MSSGSAESKIGHGKPGGRRRTPAKNAGQPSPRTDRDGIQSLERAAAILDTVAQSRDGIGLSALSLKVGLHSSTAFHLLKTLVHLGYVVQAADSKRYRIGTRIFTLAAGALGDNMLLSLATPILERLSATTGEAAHLAIRSNAEIVMIARTAATGLLQLADRAGTIRPAHATAIGKMLLAGLPAEDCARLVGSLQLNRYTANTITERGALLREIAAIRRAGMAQDRSEFDADVCCIAVSVFDFAGRNIAAMGISGPVWRMADAAVAEKSGALRQAAAALSAALGYQGEMPAA